MQSTGGTMMTAYDAFAPQSPQQQPFPAYGAAAGVSYVSGARVASAVPPGLGLSASSVDEDALSWLQRDSGDARMPSAIRHLHGSVPLFALLPCFDSEEDGVSRAQMMRNSQVRIAGQAYASFADDGSNAAAAAPTGSFLEPRLMSGHLFEIYARSGAGKTEMLYQAIVTTLLPKVKRGAQRLASCNRIRLGLSSLYNDLVLTCCSCFPVCFLSAAVAVSLV